MLYFAFIDMQLVNRPDGTVSNTWDTLNLVSFTLVIITHDRVTAAVLCAPFICSPARFISSESSEFFTKDKVTMHCESNCWSATAEEFPQCCRLERRMPLSDLTCHAWAYSDTSSTLYGSETYVISVLHLWTWLFGFDSFENWGAGTLHECSSLMTYSRLG